MTTATAATTASTRVKKNRTVASESTGSRPRRASSTKASPSRDTATVNGSGIEEHIALAALLQSRSTRIRIWS